MKLIIGEEVEPELLPKNLYRIEIETMQEYADDYHKITYDVDTAEEVLEQYAQYKLLQETSQSDWVDLSFWSEWEDSIYYSCDSNWYDSLEEFKVVYYNENGAKFTVNLVEEN